MNKGLGFAAVGYDHHRSNSFSRNRASIIRNVGRNRIECLTVIIGPSGDLLYCVGLDRRIHSRKILEIEEVHSEKTAIKFSELLLHLFQ